MFWKALSMADMELGLNIFRAAHHDTQLESPTGFVTYGAPSVPSLGLLGYSEMPAEY